MIAIAWGTGCHLDQSACCRLTLSRSLLIARADSKWVVAALSCSPDISGAMDRTIKQATLSRRHDWLRYSRFLVTLMPG